MQDTVWTAADSFHHAVNGPWIDTLHHVSRHYVFTLFLFLTGFWLGAWSRHYIHRTLVRYYGVEKRSRRKRASTE